MRPAELGYGRATFARIAERAGLSSTRLISYHFAGRSELIAALVAEAYADITRHMTERTRAATGPREALHAYIRALAGYIAEHLKRMRTLMSVFLDHRAEDGGRSYDGGDGRDVVDPVRRVLAEGQRTGEFRVFDSFVMATTIQRSIDGLPFLLRSEPDLDLASYAEELVELFDRATRASCCCSGGHAGRVAAPSPWRSAGRDGSRSGGSVRP
ncbi:TetR/AcrR family transcriptional regulator [Streptomyces sp. NBC_01324]|nr:TetR/AcrR family transcriptional regulator [Streptomyces sp. NBC_01324]